MIIGDVEMIATSWKSEILFMVTGKHGTTLVPMSPEQYIELQNELYAEYTKVSEYIRSQRGA